MTRRGRDRVWSSLVRRIRSRSAHTKGPAMSATGPGANPCNSLRLSACAPVYCVRGPDRTEEMGHADAWAGGGFELSIALRGRVALHLAARALDASLLVELDVRTGSWAASPTPAAASRPARPTSSATSSQC